MSSSHAGPCARSDGQAPVFTGRTDEGVAAGSLRCGKQPANSAMVTAPGITQKLDGARSGNRPDPPTRGAPLDSSPSAGSCRPLHRHQVPERTRWSRPLIDDEPSIGPPSPVRSAVSSTCLTTTTRRSTSGSASAEEGTTDSTTPCDEALNVPASKACTLTSSPRRRPSQARHSGFESGLMAIAAGLAPTCSSATPERTPQNEPPRRPVGLTLRSSDETETAPTPAPRVFERWTSTARRTHPAAPPTARFDRGPPTVQRRKSARVPSQRLSQLVKGRRCHFGHTRSGQAMGARSKRRPRVTCAGARLVCRS